MISSRTISKRTIQQLLRQAARSQSSSTMGLSANASRGGEETSTLSSPITSKVAMDKKQDFSTAIASHNYDDDLQHILTFADTSTNTKAFGLEVDLTQAAALIKTENMFDKIIVFISHGEAAGGGTNANPSLTGEGIGHALNISRETANFCNKSTGLVPELYVVSPLRCTAESALLAFPQYAPGNIHNKPWVCHTKCVDMNPNANMIDYVNDLEDTFPGIDYSLLKEEPQSDTIDFLSWLSKRDEKIIAVSSTKSWVDEFINTFAPTKTNGEAEGNRILRTIGVKLE